MGKSRTNAGNARQKPAPRIVEGDPASRLRSRHEGARTRTGDKTLFDKRGNYWKNGRIRRHPVTTVQTAIRLYYETGSPSKVSNLLGIPQETLRNWVRQRFLPKRGPYVFENIIELVRKARTIYQVSEETPVGAIRKAAENHPVMTWGRVKYYIYLEAMPTLPGFPLYADRMTNQKAEAYGLGVRRYSAVLGVEPPDIPAEYETRRDNPKPSALKVVPRQIGRRFFLEGQVTSQLPSRKYNLL